MLVYLQKHSEREREKEIKITCLHPYLTTNGNHFDSHILYKKNSSFFQNLNFDLILFL